MAFTNKPSLVQWQNFSFLIMDAPNDTNLHLYIKEMKKNNVTDLVRACESTYAKDQVESAGIRVHELEFQDGESPDPDIIETWLDLVEATFNSTKGSSPSKTIAVHCVAGLGRYVSSCCGKRCLLTHAY